MAETGKGGADKGASMRVDTALVRELAELLSANDLNEIEVEDGERKIKVRRDAPTAYVAAPAPVAAAAPAAESAPVSVGAGFPAVCGSVVAESAAPASTDTDSALML